MADCRTIVKYYENMNDSQLIELWNKLQKRGITPNILRDILMYYFHHQQFSPLNQKSCDILFASVYSKNVSRKQKNIISQIIEEISMCVENSIVEQVSLSSHLDAPIQLLNSFLVGGMVSLLDENTIVKLFSILSNSSTQPEDGGRLMFFLLDIFKHWPSLITMDNLTRIEAFMDGCLRHVNSKSIGSNTGFFGRSDPCVATEVDGTNAGEIYTHLTLVNNFSRIHMMAIHSFSSLKEWLDKRFTQRNLKLPEFVREYCSIITEQCLRPAQREHDMNLQKAVLCEILDILNQIAQLDSSQTSQSLIIVKRIHKHVMEHLSGNYHDIFIFSRILKFFLKFGQSTGYNSQVPCEYFLNDIINRSYTSGLAAFEIMIFLVENNQNMDISHQKLIYTFFPNILKIVACHPSVVIEEIIELIPACVSVEHSLEMFYRLIDLPLLTATLCLHQAQSDSFCCNDIHWSSMYNGVRTPEVSHIFDYLMCSKAGEKISLDGLHSYMNILSELASHSLVVMCSQIVPLLCDAFFSSIAQWKNIIYVAPVVRGIFDRMELLFGVPNYSASIKRCLLIHMKCLFQKFPALIISLQNLIIDYILSFKHCETFPQLYMHIIYVVGDYSYNGDIDNAIFSQISKYYETVESTIYYTLADVATNEPVSFQLLNILCSTLSKLAAKCPDNIPRAVLCLNKVRMRFSTKSVGTDDESSIICNRIDELICLLQNPSVASMIWSDSLKPQMTSFVQVLGHITLT